MSKMFQVYGIGQALIPVLPPPLPFQNAPTSNQTNYEIGQVVFTPPKNPTAFYMYGGGGNWVEFATSSGDVTSVTGTANQILASPTSGAVVLSLIGPYTPATYTAHGVLIGEGTSSIVATSAGTAGQILQSGGASADPAWTTATYPATTTINQLLYSSAANTVSGLATANSAILNTSSGGVPSLATSPSVSGTITAGTGLTATTGNITATAGNLVLGTAGNKIVSTSVGSGTSAGANSFGTVTLGSGTATVSTTAVTASSIILLTRQSPGSTGANALGQLSIGTVSAGTSFVINALTTANSTTNATTDVSVVGWMIIN